VAALAFAQSRLIGPVAWWRGRREPLTSRLARLLNDRDSARVIGRAYLQKYAEGADCDVVLDQLVRDIAGFGGSVAPAGDKELKAAVEARIRQDFADDRVVKLEGWILSGTEARLCALTTLA
jgi:hypothetical protein